MNEPKQVEIAKGATVGHIARPGRWKVERVLKVNVEIRALDGQMPALVRAKPYSLTEPPKRTPAGESMTVDLPTYFEPGQIVTSFIPTITGQLFVVERDNGGPKVTVVTLFGGNGWHVPRQTLSAVSPSELVRVLLLRAYPNAVGGDEQSAISLVRQMLDDNSAEYDRRMIEGNGS